MNRRQHYPRATRTLAAFAVALALFGLVSASPAQSTTDTTQEKPTTSKFEAREKRVIRAAVAHDATVFAATYSHSRKNGFTWKLAVRAGEKAISSIRAHGYTRNIIFDRYRAAVSVDSPTGITYCINIKLSQLENGYNPGAISKPLLGQYASYHSSSSSTCTKPARQ